MLPREQAEAMAEEVGVEYGRLMAETLGDAADRQRSFRSALHTVADALTAHGFAAHAEKHERRAAHRLRALPLRRRRHRAPGDLRRRPGHGEGMLAALYGADATLAIESSLPMGDDVCVTALEA